MRIGIVGIGLIGGSIAKALKAAGRGPYIVGVDTDAAALAAALHAGALDEAAADCAALSGCEAVFLCVPPQAMPAALQEVYLAVGETAVVTDVASVKQPVLRELPAEMRFVGGHPMAGVEGGGFASSKAHLFQNAYYCLVTEGAAPEDVSAVEALVRDMRAIPVRVTAAEHDAAVSKISHLPHMAAFALVNTALRGELTRKLAAGGFRDITRIASSSPRLWEEIASLNKENLVRDIDDYVEQLQLIKRFLLEGNRLHFVEFMQSAREKRDSLSDTNTGALSRAFELRLDIEDRPGIIGRVTSVLARARVSIANIYVENSREGSEGVLRLRFFDAEGLTRARSALAKKKILRG